MKIVNRRTAIEANLRKTAKKEKYKDSKLIPYPKSYSELEVHCFLLCDLRRRGLDARGDVISKDMTSRLDIVVFEGKVAKKVIEVKKDENTSVSHEQINKYKKYGLEFHLVMGMEEAKKFMTKKKKGKITEEGQACRKCGTPVIKKKAKNIPHKGQTYYFKFYLGCPKCGTMYMQESEKVYLTKEK